MNKTDFIAGVAEKAGLTKEQARKAVDAFAAVVAEELQKGEKVSLRSRRHQSRHQGKDQDPRTQGGQVQGWRSSRPERLSQLTLRRSTERGSQPYRDG